MDWFDDDNKRFNLASPVRSSAALERKKFVSLLLDIYLWCYCCYLYTFGNFVSKDKDSNPKG